MLKVDNVSKKYKLGQIGGTTLRQDLQRLHAKLRHQEDPTKMIGAKDYNKGETFMALDGVSFEVKKGERVGIIGHNGAGKSTIMKLISRITAPTDGKIYMNGRVASMLEVGTGFHGELTGRENIYVNGAILGMTKKEIDAKMQDIIEFSECQQFIDTPVKRYSSGMYVKLAFSVMAHLDADIMIMDEVLAVGDMAFQNKCLDKMNDVSRAYGKTILYVSHNMNTIRQLCDRVIVMNHGKILYDGDVEEGISIYSKDNQSQANDIDFSTYRRESWLMRDILRMSYLCVNNENGMILDKRQKTSMEFRFTAQEIPDNVGICVDIRDEQRYSIGSYIVFNVPIQKGENRVKLAFDFGMLAPGRYHSAISILSLGVGGSQTVEDWVPGPIFQIAEDDTADVKFNWNRKSLGNIIFPTPEFL